MFQLDLTSHKSIYEQVMINIKELIMANILCEGAKLPSVRELSKDLTVNPNTIQKAYKELEREGFIYTTSGIGTFVANRLNIKPNIQKIAQIKENILSSYKELIYLGLSESDARQIVYDLIEERSLGK